MEVVELAVDAGTACTAAREDGCVVGLVPTMGSLHDGHLSLMRRAREECDFVVVSVFVNPLQFGESEDFRTYPRDVEGDVHMAENEGIDLMFVPDVEQMYPDGYPPALTIDPGPLGDRLEGEARPGHFRGVLTVVARLFDIVGACRAYFGEKDAQQLFLVTQMVQGLAMPVDVVPCPTVREADGLALSSRNAHLNGEGRQAARCLDRALAAASGLFASGERRRRILVAEMERQIGAEPLATIDYAAVVDPASFGEVGDEVGSEALALVAARIGETRLIDNLRLPSDPPV